jgi:hypothetical protein
MEDVARVILAIGSQEVAEEVLHLLDRSGRARVVATAADDRQLAEAVRQLEPDAVVAEPAIAAAGVGSAALLALTTRESIAHHRHADDASRGAAARREALGRDRRWMGQRQEGGLRRATLEGQPSAHDLGEDDRVVMLRVSSGENERERAVPRLPPELRETRTLPAKLIHVAAAELNESARIVSEPRPQLGAWRQLRFPCVQRRSLPRHPSRPEAVDKDSVPVRTLRGLVHALQSDIHRGPPYAPETAFRCHRPVGRVRPSLRRPAVRRGSRSAAGK